MITEKQIFIDDVPYVVEMLNGNDAIDAFGTISPLFFPVLGIIGDEIVNNLDGFETEIFTALGTSISHALSQPEVREVAKKVVGKVRKFDKPIDDVGEEFKGNFKGYMKLITFAFKENFLDFFLEALESLGLDLKMIQELGSKLEDSLKQFSAESENNAVSEEKTASS